MTRALGGRARDSNAPGPGGGVSGLVARSQMTAAQQDLVRRIDAYGGADTTTLDLVLAQIDAPEADKRAVASWYGVDLATKETA